MTAALVVAAVLAVLAVGVVAAPFLRDPDGRNDVLERRDLLDERRLELSEERDRALFALRELEFDHRTGKISDDDYRTLVGDYRRQAAAAMRALEPTTRRRQAVDVQR